MKRETFARAEFIGHQDDFEGSTVALFNILCPGNKLHGSTVAAETIVKLGISILVDGDGKRLLAVPAPKQTEELS